MTQKKQPTKYWKARSRAESVRLYAHGYAQQSDPANMAPDRKAALEEGTKL